MTSFAWACAFAHGLGLVVEIKSAHGDIPAKPMQRVPHDPYLIRRAWRNGHRLEVDLGVTKQHEQRNEIIGIARFHVPNNVKHIVSNGQRERIRWTRPTCPDSRRTLMPRG